MSPDGIILPCTCLRPVSLHSTRVRVVQYTMVGAAGVLVEMPAPALKEGHQKENMLLRSRNCGTRYPKRKAGIGKCNSIRGSMLAVGNRVACASVLAQQGLATLVVLPQPPWLLPLPDLQ